MTAFTEGITILLLLCLPLALVSFALYAVLEPKSWKMHALLTIGYILITGAVSLVSAAVASWRGGAFEAGEVVYTFTTITVCMIVGLGGYYLFRPYL
ncbi:hypothetical protein CHL76_08910 [Marinococcus halophilus]|uniref:Uncharacterized protein n=1 Tax=Marinococcus halophilus TaxID=1371 RepID=A0A510Y4K6_MARHA|nr:hypothetical protein [Marinococcus halophilus]OZT80215.1 hypothetical protein CHL76_08910 [Marinococcus halophilus]GEK58270.1 hypothetical protein MHA01_11750 [Marinococcus halophilus]